MALGEGGWEEGGVGGFRVDRRKYDSSGHSAPHARSCHTHQEATMPRIRHLAFLAAFLVATPLAAQKKTADKPSPARDSLKALTREVKEQKAAAKAAKKAGDTTKARQIKHDMKKSEAARDSLKKKLGPKNPVVPLTPAKKP
jgi:hypothetical protein